MKTKEALAIDGGPKIREKPLPYRKLFGEAELRIVERVFEDAWQEGVDFGYQGKYEKLYTDDFCKFQGGGFADAVSSGTAAIYVALMAMELEAGSDVIVSPVTDPGSIAPVIIAGMNPVVADSRPGSFNIGPDEFHDALTTNTSAAILTHVGGHPIQMDSIMEIANSKGIKIIEDCSQSHGAIFGGNRVGCFGDIAVFSTMFSKNHATGGCGGLVYTRNEDYYWQVRSLADRGKSFDDPGFDPKNPSMSLFPALNFNLDELSCAIGFSTLSRLQGTIDKRLEIADKIDEALSESSVVYPCWRLPNSRPSVFFHTVMVDTGRLKVSKERFAQAVSEEGIGVNPHYKYVVSEWEWMQMYMTEKNVVFHNATKFRNSSFNILFNERFTDKEVQDIIRSILKVESHYVKE